MLEETRAHREEFTNVRGETDAISDELLASFAGTLSSIACAKPKWDGISREYKQARNGLGETLKALTTSSFTRAAPDRKKQLQCLHDKVGAVFTAKSEDWPSHDTARILAANSARLGSFGHFPSSAGREVYGDSAYKELRWNLSEEIACLEGRTAQAAELKEAVDLAIMIDKDRISTESFNVETESLTKTLSDFTI